MVITFESLGVIFLLVSAAALGLSLVHDVGRLSTEKARTALLQREIDKKNALIKEWLGKIDGYNREMRTQQARFTEFNGRKQRVAADIAEVEMSKIEMVHEMGEAMGLSTTTFWARLRPGPGFKTVARQDIIFSRQIWGFRNVAHVEASSPERAVFFLQAALGIRSGLINSAVMPLSLAPKGPEDDPEEQAEKAAAARRPNPAVQAQAGGERR